MGPEESWRIVESQRYAIADIMETLDPTRWALPSLCAEWRVRDVVAHLVLGSQRLRAPVIFQGAVRARGNFNRMNRDMAVAYASRPTQMLVAELRQGATSVRYQLSRTIGTSCSTCSCTAKTSPCHWESS